MRQDYRRYLGHTGILGRRHAPMPGDDFQILVQQYRIDKPELADRFTYLRHLGTIVQLRVVFIRPNVGYFYVLYF